MKFRFVSYLKRDIWHIKLSVLSRKKALWITFLRTATLIIQGFTKSRIQQGASTLTYYTLFSVVPIIALLIGLSNGFDLGQNIQEWFSRLFSEQRTSIKEVFETINASFTSANKGWLLSIGVLILLWVGVRIFLCLETVLNNIWEVSQRRTFAKFFTDFLALVSLCPLAIFLINGLIVYFSSYLVVGKTNTFLEHINQAVFSLLSLLPTIFTCFFLTFIYIFIPNTRVKFFPAMCAGIIIGVLYKIVELLYIYLQIGVSHYNAIYGTFAILPLFLIWVRVSWSFILAGARMAFAFQNSRAFDFMEEDFHLSHKSTVILSLNIAHYCTKTFCEGREAPSSNEISNKLSIPLPIVNDLIQHLVEAGVISEIKKRDMDSGFQPAHNIEDLTIKHVIDLINMRGDEIHVPVSNEIRFIVESLEKFDKLVEGSDGNILLKNI